MNENQIIYAAVDRVALVACVVFIAIKVDAVAVIAPFILSGLALNWFIYRYFRRKVAILEILSDGRLTGLEIVKKSNGKIRRWQVYVLLSQLEDEGLVDSRVIDGGTKRRDFGITEQGQAKLLVSQ